jgi:hypothetical protein
MFRINVIILAALFGYGLCPYQPKETDHMSKLSAGASVIDGPYVLYRNDSVFVNYIEDNGGLKSVRTENSPSSAKTAISLQINTDVPGKTFTVQLKPKLSNERSEYNGVKKMLVISDIEGGFEALRKLLQGNGVVDDNFNWTYGKDHLVLIGDFVDRGTMVTEVLWFIYMLEEKAKAAGGYVHYILGNHEIMNMSNDLSYVNERYIQHAQLLDKPYMQLFGPEAELGRWLATKNVAERIGKTLFTHGGISSYMNQIALPLKELNDITRAYYTDTNYNYKDQRLNIIYSDFGPFWYRGYYKPPRAGIGQVDSTLNIYGVNQITTGHTIISTEIRSLYNGKLYNTDVHHAEGLSEALLIDDKKFWRVNNKGEKFGIRPV